MRHTIIGLSVLASLAMASAAIGSTMELPTVDHGFYYSTGFSPAPYTRQGAFTVGRSASNVYRDWISFDLSTVSDPIVSAELWVDIKNYFSTDPTETLTLYSIETSPGLLGTAAGQPIAVGDLTYFNDLGDGDLYGSREFSANDAGTLTPITLSTAAVKNLNTRRLETNKTFEIGGILASDDGRANQYLFLSATTFPNPAYPELRIVTRPVPEPATIILCSMLGALGLAVGAYRRRKAA